MGHKPAVFPASALGVPNYAELVLVANRNRLTTDKSYAAAVREFAKALVQGTNAAIADPSGATSIMQQVSQYKPEFLQASVPFTLKLIASADEKTGCMSETAWQSFGDWMQKNKLIHIMPKAAQLTTDKYLPYSC
jgi:putative hydroxymethylpyrimidine transport system substrate-binding protein